MQQWDQEKSQFQTGSNYMCKVILWLHNKAMNITCCLGTLYCQQ